MVVHRSSRAATAEDSG